MKSEHLHSSIQALENATAIKNDLKFYNYKERYIHATEKWEKVQEIILIISFL